MFNNEEVKFLLSIPKVTKNKVIIDLTKEKLIIPLISNTPEQLFFKFHIWNSKKINLKLSLHHDTENIGLIRVDYNGSHKNPEEITEYVPENLRPYAGYKFFNEPHIHIYVQEWDLKWALPLKQHSFAVKDIKDFSDIEKAIWCFQEEISLKTELSIIKPISFFTKQWMQNN